MIGALVSASATNDLLDHEGMTPLALAMYLRTKLQQLISGVHYMQAGRVSVTLNAAADNIDDKPRYLQLVVHACGLAKNK